MQILIVIVLYKRLPGQSQTITSLAEVFSRAPELQSAFRVFVWDNSPEALSDGSLPFPAYYRRDGRNLGTSGAYNHAMAFAQSIASPWLLLLDQDTIVTSQLLTRMLGYGKSLLYQSDVGTVVGFIYSHGALVSPRRLRRFNAIQQIPATFDGICRQKAYAVNSGTLMRVSALEEIGGYSNEFWLDLSDVYVFRAMYEKGRYIYVAGDIRVEHSIASMDFDKEMSPERYEHFIAAESAYIDLYLPPIERVAQLLRLFVRTVRQYRKYENKVFAKISMRYFFRRLLQTRDKRLAGWRELLARRDIPVIENGQIIR